MVGTFGQTTTEKRGIVLYLLCFSAFIGLSLLLYPYFKYSVYSDIISHLSVSDRYIKGDFSTAINAFWSPLNAWIVAFIVKASGWPLFPVAYGVATLAFTGVLGLSLYLFRCFFTTRAEQYIFGLTNVVFWACSMQTSLFADGLNCFLSLLYLLVLLRDDYLGKPRLWVLSGIIAGLCYYSKAYSFYILPLITLVIVARNLSTAKRFTWVKWLQVNAVIICIMLLVTFPWLYLIHQKYGIWTLSTAGMVNTNWALAGTITFEPQYNILVPPAYPDGLSCWEDVWIHHAPLIKPWDSAGLFLKQIARVGINVVQLVKTENEFSPFYFPIVIAALLFLLSGKKSNVPGKISGICLALLLYPLGYLPMVIAGRYLWFTIPLVMVAGLYFSKVWLFPVMREKRWKIYTLVYMISWLPGILLVAKDTINEGRTDYAIAMQLKQLQVKGSFLANQYQAYQQHFRLSWYTGNPFYIHIGDNWSTKQLLEEARKMHVKYYYYFYNGANNDYILLQANGLPYPELTRGTIKGLKVFQLE